LAKINFPISLILIVAVLLRFFNLGGLPGSVFDEVYYPVFALKLLSGQEYFSVHPPIGVYLTSLSIYLHSILPWTDPLLVSGFDINNVDPISYRWLPAFIGVVLVYVSYLLSLQISDKKYFALLVALFFCLDGSMLVDSRFGLINIYLVFFGFLGLLFLFRAIKSPENLLETFLSAIFVGLALSVKWNGLGFWALSLCVLFFIAITNRFEIKIHHKWYVKNTLLCRSFCVVIAVPILIYLISWAPYFYIYEHKSFLDTHNQLLSFHSDSVDPKSHPYESKWYTWPFAQRPMGYFFEVIGEGNDTDFTSVHLFPNPMLYWFGLAAVLILSGKFLMATRSFLFTRTADFTYFFMFFVVFGYFGNLLPWILVSRSTFLYHYQPSSGFAFLALAFFVSSLLDNNKGQNRLFASIIITLILAATIYWIPLQLGISVNKDYFYQLMWFDSWI
jgi:dolichyl-phosphate-mannose-protein mannosyltransferase